MKKKYYSVGTVPNSNKKIVEIETKSKCFPLVSKLSTLLYVRIDSLLTSGKHLHNCITSLNWSVWVHKTSLTPPVYCSAYKLATIYICVWDNKIDFPTSYRLYLIFALTKPFVDADRTILLYGSL
jgi:hypothetical protein